VRYVYFLELENGDIYVGRQTIFVADSILIRQELFLQPAKIFPQFWHRM